MFMKKDCSPDEVTVVFFFYCRSFKMSDGEIGRRLWKNYDA